MREVGQKGFCLLSLFRPLFQKFISTFPPSPGKTVTINQQEKKEKKTKFEAFFITKKAQMIQTPFLFFAVTVE